MLKEDLQSSDLVRQVGRKPYQIVAPDWRTVREHFAQLVPTRPYCADNPQDGSRDSCAGTKRFRGDISSSTGHMTSDG